MTTKNSTLVWWTSRASLSQKGTTTCRCREKLSSVFVLLLRLYTGFHLLIKGDILAWLILLSLPYRTLLALGCHVGMGDEKAEENLKKIKLPKTYVKVTVSASSPFFV